MKLVIEGTLPGLNEYVDACRAHRQAGAKMKEQTEQYIWLSIKNQVKSSKFDVPVDCRYLWVEPNKRRDKDNISAFGRKCIQDVLVNMGVIKSDGWKHIKGFTDSFDVDRDRPRVEVTITEV